MMGPGGKVHTSSATCPPLAEEAHGLEWLRAMLPHLTGPLPYTRRGHCGLRPGSFLGYSGGAGGRGAEWLRTHWDISMNPSRAGVGGVMR